MNVWTCDSYSYEVTNLLCTEYVNLPKFEKGRETLTIRSSYTKPPPFSLPKRGEDEREKKGKKEKKKKKKKSKTRPGVLCWDNNLEE